MEIITAKEARKMTDEYIPYDIKRTIEIVMKEIKDATTHGNNSIKFVDYYCSSVDFKILKTEKFVNYIKKLGYTYDFYILDNLGLYDETVKISW